MTAPVWSRSVAIGAGVAGLILACNAAPAADGASCTKDLDCGSGRCSADRCDGTDCTCDSPDCHSRSSCLAGWLCTRGDAISLEAAPRCRLECTTSAGCPSNKHCDNGVCKTGPAPFVLSWGSFPRTPACAAKVPCAYKVSVSAGTTVTTFTWTFGAAPPVVTKDPSTTFTYDVPGTYTVHVQAQASTGAVATLDETEILCVGGPGTVCDPQGAPCCGGMCSGFGLCE
jgi:hypothetical protein